MTATADAPIADTTPGTTTGTGTGPRTDARMISVDDHVVEPPGVWWDRLSAKDREILHQAASILNDLAGR